MTTVAELVDVSIGLTAVPTTQTVFTIPLLLVDHADIPLDRRYRITTKSSYATDLTASTTHLAWCTELWSQNYNPAQAYIGRWISAASSPYIYFPSVVSTVATYTGISDGTIRIIDSGSAQDDLTALNFTACTSMADVAAVIQTALQAITSPNISGLDTATCVIDTLDRLVIANSTTGASATTLSASAQGTGTDLTGASYFGTEYSQAGLDAEALGTAAAAIFALDNTAFLIAQLGGSIAEVTALSTAVAAMDKFLLLDNNDSNAKDSGQTSDIGYQIEALSHNQTYNVYTEHTTHYPSAGIIGEVLSRPNGEGRASLALNALSGVSESGLHTDTTTVIPLTATERTALEAKGYDYLINPAGSVHAVTGLTAGGNEARVIIGKMYFEAMVSTDCYAFLLANEVTTYSDSDVQAIKGIISYWAEEMVDRGLLDPDSFVWDMPSASSFNAATKQTHTLTLSNCFQASVLSAVNDMIISLNFSL